jgi:hypothetical protein
MFGTKNAVVIVPVELDTHCLTCVPLNFKVTAAFATKPKPITLTAVPTVPVLGVNVMVHASEAKAAGAIATVKVVTLRRSNAKVTMLSFFLELIECFSN